MFVEPMINMSEKSPKSYEDTLGRLELLGWGYWNADGEWVLSLTAEQLGLSEKEKSSDSEDLN
jgi:hypothetical protein